MEKNRAIPEGYRTVGEVAKKMGVTVRTLQYYDKEGLLSPSSESEGGLRLYADKDVVKLHQILSLKHLGFSLDDIKNRIISLDTPANVAEALTEQAAIIREKIKNLSDSLGDVEALKAEVLQMQSVDFKKYADIIINLQMKNEFYWLIKHFDDKTLDFFHKTFDKDSSSAMMMTFNRLLDEAVQLQNDGVPPESEKGQGFAKEFWEMLMNFTGGDMNLLTKLTKVKFFESPNKQWNQKHVVISTYIAPALGAYFTALGYDPFQA